MDLIGKAGGLDSIDEISNTLGISASDTPKLLGALTPAFARSMQKQTESSDSLAGFAKALDSGKHKQYLDKPDLVSSAASVMDGNNILGHLFGSKDVSRNVAAQAADSTGIDAGIVKKALPMIAGIAMGAMSKNRGADDASGSNLGNLLSGLVGDNDSGGGIELDDVLGFAKKLF